MSSPEIKLKRFLHYGRETPLYSPVDRSMIKFFTPGCLPCIEELLADGKTTEIAGAIVKAYSDGYSAHPECLVYALAVCARQETCEVLREAAYNAVKTVCKSPKLFLLFIKFANDLAAPKTAWGQGCRRVIKEWYLKQDPMELAQIVTRYKRYAFWSHKDILKLAHPPSDEGTPHAAVFKYIVRGLKEAQQAHSNDSACQQVLTYLQTVEDFSHSKEDEYAARLLEVHSFSIEHIPPQLIKSKEVWSALVPHLPLGDLLQNLKRFTKLRFLRSNNLFVTKVVDALRDQTAIAESNLHPAQVLIVLRSYENSGRPKFVNPEKEVKPPPPPNMKIIEAINSLLNSTFKLLVPTGMRYVIAVDTRVQMQQGKCFMASHVSPLQAAALLALCLVSVEREVTVLTFTPQGLHPVNLEKSLTFDDAFNKLKEKTTPTDTDVAQPILWAKANKKEVDVFISVTDNRVRSGKVKASTALASYRTAMNLPTVKFVACGLSCPRFEVASPDDPGMLDIAGFDGQVPRVIEAFSRGAF